MADDDTEAVVLTCTSSVFCALDLHQSREQILEKSEVDMSTPVHAVATPLNTCRSSRACRARRDDSVAACCPTSATRLDTSRNDFAYAKMYGLGSVSCRDVTSQVEFQLSGCFASCACTGAERVSRALSGSPRKERGNFCPPALALRPRVVYRNGGFTSAWSGSR